MISLLSSFCCLSLLLTPAPAPEAPALPSPGNTAQDDKPKDAKAKAGDDATIPAHITADNCDMIREDNTTIFSGNVKVDDAQFKLACDKMTIFSAKVPIDPAQPEGKTKNKPDRILCEHKVVIHQEGNVITGDRAEYFLADDRMVITGNPQVVDDKGQIIRARVITYFRKDGRINFQGIEIDGKEGATEFQPGQS